MSRSLRETSTTRLPTTMTPPNRASTAAAIYFSAMRAVAGMPKSKQPTPQPRVVGGGCRLYDLMALRHHARLEGAFEGTSAVADRHPPRSRPEEIDVQR